MFAPTEYSSVHLEPELRELWETIYKKEVLVFYSFFMSDDSLVMWGRNVLIQDALHQQTLHITHVNI